MDGSGRLPRSSTHTLVDRMRIGPIAQRFLPVEDQHQALHVPQFYVNFPVGYIFSCASANS